MPPNKLQAVLGDFKLSLTQFVNNDPPLSCAPQASEQP
jgi:hypothetical protein